MNGVALRILKKVAKSGEVSVSEAIRLARLRHNDHRDQYPLALLLEQGYLGMTIDHRPPSGAEQMREFTLATTLHLYYMPKDERGDAQYRGIRSTGGLDPKDESIFLKAKGALYLDERRQKRWDRVWFFVLGLIAGVLTSIASAWAQGKLRMP
jgi:hypothetical protein